MNALRALVWPISEAVVERLGWVLVHSLWQLALAGLLAAVAARALRRRSAATRYRVLVAALALAAAAPVATWLLLPVDSMNRSARQAASTLGQEPGDRTNVPVLVDQATLPGGKEIEVPASMGAARSAAPATQTEVLSAATTTLQAAPHWSERIKSMLRPWLAWLVGFWSLGIVVCSLRPLLGWHMLSRLRRVGVAPASDDMLAALRRVAERLGLRCTVRILQSTLAQAPVVVGYLRPVILLPVSLVTCLPAAQLDAILAHELAHVRRHDFVINLLQTLIETMFFYHPAVWWLSRQVRVEREHCCDDFVVQLLDNRVEYGRALVAIEQWRGQKPVLALGATDGSLLARVRRILGVGADRNGISRLSRWPAALLVVAGIGTALALSLSWRLAAMDAVEPADDATTKYSAKLPNGAVIELAGIGFHPSQQRAWWLADGTMLPAPPRDAALKQVRLSESNAGRRQHECREFAIRISGLPNQKALFAYQFGYEPYVDAAHRAVLYEPTEFRMAELPPLSKHNVKTATLRVGIGELPDQFSRSIGPDGKKLGEAPTQQALRQADDWVQPVRVEDRNGQTQLLLKNVRRGAGPFFVEYAPVAIDRDGQKHHSIQAGSPPGFFAYLYPLARDRILRFDYRLRLYEHWVTFENVSLHPGTKTDVKVTVASLPPEPARLRVRNADGSQAVFNNIVLAQIGFPKASPMNWVATPTRDGLVSLAKLQPGAHWLLAAGDAEDRTLFPVRLPADRPVLERRLRAGRAWTQKNIDIKPMRQIDASEGEVIVVEIRNRTGEDLPVSEEDVQLICAFQGESIRGLSPRWHAGTFPQVKIEAGKTERLRLNWPDWVRRGLWTSRNHEVMAEPGFPPAEPGKIWMRVSLGNHGALPISVTDPLLILAQADKQAPAQPAPAPTFVLSDHLNVMAVGFEPDGKSLVSVATERDIAIRIWDLGARKLRQEVKLADAKHPNSFLDGHLSLSADRKRLVAIMDNEVKIWETSTGKLVKTLTLPLDRMQGFTVPGRGSIRGLAGTPDLSRIACGWTPGGLAHDSYAVVWDVASGQVVQTVQHADAVQSTCVALSHDGKWLATGSQQAGTCVWEVGTGNRLLVLPNANPGIQHPDPKVSEIAANQVLCLAFSPDGKQLAVGDLLGVKLLDAKTGKQMHRLAAPFRFGRSGLVFSKDGQMLARVATDKTVPIWSAQTGNKLVELPAEAHGGTFSDDGRWFAVGSTDSKNGVAVWRLRVGSAGADAQPSAQQQAAKNLSVIMEAMRRYHDDPRHGRLPPAVIMGKDGKGNMPHSWRIEILPYLGEQALYDEYRFEEAWDSQHNRRLLARMPAVFRSPLDHHESTRASCFAVVTPGLQPQAADAAGASAGGQFGELAKPNYHHGTVFSDPAGVHLPHIPDGMSNVVALVEAKRDIPWTQPLDIPCRADKPLPKLGGWFAQGWHAAFADGKVKLLAADNDDITVRRLFTIGDGHNVAPKIVASPTDAVAPPGALEFLASYPKLQGLSLDMTEQQFLLIVKNQKLQPRKTAAGGGTQYHIATGDGHTVIVMFRNNEPKCTGIQRVRGENPPEPAPAAAPGLSISGRVLDAETGKPIANGRIVPTGFEFDDSPDRITWQSQYLKEFAEGRFRYDTDRPWEKTRLRIEADGYRPAMTRVVNRAEKSVEIDVKLVRDIYAGVVLLPNGQPAAKAQLAVASHTNEVTVRLGKLTYGGHGARLRKVAEADEQGRFELPAESDPSVLVVAHASGYAEITTIEPATAKNARESQPSAAAKPKNHQALKITVQPWGRVEGRIFTRDKPVVGAKYWVYQARTDDVFVRSNHDVESDAEGRFVIERIPPGGHGICQRYVANSDGNGGHSLSGLIARFDIPTGKTTTLQLGSPGRTLFGKLAVPDGFPHKVDWSKAGLSVTLQAPSFRRLTDGNESGQSWAQFLQTDEGKLYTRANVAINADGSFRIEGLPAAEYQLSVQAGDPLRGSFKFSVPPLMPPAAPAPVDLGTMKLVSRLPNQVADSAPQGAAQQTSLGKAIDDFNLKAKADPIYKDQPPLTQEEVIAALGAARKADSPKATDALFQSLKRIADTEVMPANAAFEARNELIDCGDVVVDVWEVRLGLPKSDSGLHYFSIRAKQFGQTRTIAAEADRLEQMLRNAPVLPGRNRLEERLKELRSRPQPKAPAPTAEAVFARQVSLTALSMPLKDALAAVARAAKVELQLDVAALKEVGLDVELPVTATIKDEPLGDALGSLIQWDRHVGVFRELRGGKLHVTTIQARQADIERHLPDWLKPHFNHGLLATLDDDRNVVAITAGEAMTDELLGKLNTLPKLRELHVETTKRLTPAGLKQLAALSSLQKLSLYSLFHEGNGLGDAAIQGIVALKSLRELSLGTCGTTDAGVRLLEGMPQLTHLSLSTEGRLTDAALTSIATLKRLKALSLSSYVATAQLGRMRFSAAAIRRLAGLHELEELHLVGHEVPADALVFPRLKSLSLGFESIDDAVAKRIAAFRELTSLDLVYTGITDDGLLKIAELPALKRLNLDSHVVTDAGIGHLKKLSTLEHLSLRAARLSDESLRHLAQIKSLRRVDLYGSGEPGAVVGKCFTIEGVQQLKALPNLRTLWLTNFESAGGFLGLKELTQLRQLTMMMTNLRDDELDALEDALPKTQIHHATGGGKARVRKNR